MLTNTPLSHTEFEKFLHAGHGRAALHVQQHGLTEVFDIVLDACVHSRVYDSQVNGVLGTWLFGLVKDSAEFPQIRSAVLEALATSTDERDLMQLLEFSAEIALSGDQAAFDAVKKCALAIVQSNEDIHMSIGRDEYVAIGGLDAAFDIAAAYGERLADATVEGGEFGGYGTADLIFEDEQIDAELMSLLAERAVQNAALATYLRYRQWGDGPSISSETNSRSPRKNRYKDAASRRALIDTLFAFENKSEFQYPGGRMALGKHATPDELQEIYERLLQTGSEEMQKRLLWVFRRAPLPAVDPAIIAFANSEYGLLRCAAISALSHSADEQVRALALDKLTQPLRDKFDREVLSLFEHNYQLGDATMIVAWLEQQSVEPWSMHSLCWSLRDVAERIEFSAESIHLMLWSYHNTPCMTCRHKALELLAQEKALTPSILNECLYDADELIRALASNLINSAET